MLCLNLLPVPPLCHFINASFGFEMLIFLSSDTFYLLFTVLSSSCSFHAYVFNIWAYCGLPISESYSKEKGGLLNNPAAWCYLSGWLHLWCCWYCCFESCRQYCLILVQQKGWKHHTCKNIILIFDPRNSLSLRSTITLIISMPLI